MEENNQSTEDRLLDVPLSAALNHLVKTDR